MAGLTDAERKLSRNQREGSVRAPAAGAAGRSRHLRSRSHLIPLGVRPQRHRHPAAVDRVRQRREPAAVARGRTLPRSVGATVDGRIAAPAGAAAADGEPAAVRHRRRCLASRWATGARSCCRSAQNTAIDWQVLAFVAGISMLTGLIFGLVPAMRATQVDLSSAMKENSRSVAASRTWLSKALLVTQVAVSVVLLIGAGLFVRTLQNLQSVDVGFSPGNILMFRINPGAEPLFTPSARRSCISACRPRSRRCPASRRCRSRARRCYPAAPAPPASTGRARPPRRRSTTSTSCRCRRSSSRRCRFRC